jgi:CubicO group peptidase (beta-lactamase class C family)
MRWIVSLVAGVLAAGTAVAQTPLSDFIGTYSDGPGHEVEILVDAMGRLIAAIDEAGYPLQVTGVDQLTNGAGAIVHFHRNAAGAIDGYMDDGQRHDKLSPNVSADTLAMLASPARTTGEQYSYRAPLDRHDGIAIGDISRTPLGIGTAEKIVAKVVDGTYPGVHSVLLYQDGRLVLEEYFYGYSVDRQQQLRSATKSVVSAVTGTAVDRGALSAQTPALARLGLAAYANPDPRKERITVGDFLTMRSGLACNDHSSDSPGRETVIDAQPDWIQAMYDLRQIGDPGNEAFYCSGGVAVVGRVVEKSTASYLPDYAARYLFKPLGIKPTDWTWHYELTNRDKEYSQIHMRPRDMLKLGILYANGGTWHGKRVISKDWVDESLVGRSTVDDTEYGYFWWRPWLNVDGTRVYVSAAQGNGGQKIYVLAQYHLVAVFTGGLYNSSGSPMNKIMASDILPRLVTAYPKAKTVPTAPRH